MTDTDGLRLLRWTGTAFGVAGALLVALNLPASGWGFALFLVSSTCWTAAGLLRRDPALWTLNAAFTAINALGIWRWLLT